MQDAEKEIKVGDVKHTVRSKSIIYLLFFILVIWVFGSMSGIYYGHYQKTPVNTYYAQGTGFLPDYYQYVSWIKSGMMKQILLTNRYTEKPHTPTLFNPFFLLMGNVMRPFHVSPFTVFSIFRYISMFLFLMSVWMLFTKVIKRNRSRLLTLIVFITMGSFWRLGKEGGTWVLLDPMWLYTNFNVIGKFMLPPHHLLALACMITVLFLVHSERISPFVWVAIALLVTGAGFANPYITSCFWIFFVTSIVLQIMILRTKSTVSIRRYLVVLILMVPVIAYHTYLSYHIYPWTQMFITTREFNPIVPFTDYLLALGPVFFLSLPVLFTRRAKMQPLLLTFIVWAYMPLLLLPLSTTYIPFSSVRIFQLYQYIPLTLLAVFGIERISQGIQKLFPFFTLLPFVIAAGLVAYNAVPIVLSFQRIIAYAQPNYYNVYIPLPALRAFQYLDSMTPPYSVVLSGERVSNMIPAFTHNRVILGRGDADPDDYTKLLRSINLLNGELTQEEAWQFFQDYHISYILLGIDAQVFRDSPIRLYPFLKEIFHEGNVSVVHVI